MTEDNNVRQRVQSTVEKLIRQREENAGKKEKAIEDEQLYAVALNGVAASEYGEHVLKVFIRALGVFKVKSGRDGVALIEDNAKSNFYMEFIRPYLTPETRQKLEN